MKPGIPPNDLLILHNYHVDSLALFGSWARGEGSDTSDIDILVDLLPGADLLDLSGLKIYNPDIYPVPGPSS